LPFNVRFALLLTLSPICPPILHEAEFGRVTARDDDKRRDPGVQGDFVTRREGL
jgi:hypothetical protein